MIFQATDDKCASMFVQSSVLWQSEPTSEKNLLFLNLEHDTIHRQSVNLEKTIQINRHRVVYPGGTDVTEDQINQINNQMLK